MRRPVEIKVCGMRNPENLEQLCTLEPDYVGFIFYPGSKRYVGNQPDPALFKIPTSKIRKVGVFVNESPAVIKELCEKYCMDLVQLHGKEPPVYCRDLMEAGIRVIKALGPYSRLTEYKDAVNFYLFDTPGPDWGGTGKKFEWDLVTGRSIPLPFLISGGIGPDDTDAVRQIGHPNFRGVDLNSRFENSPGMKNIGQLKRFITELRNESHGI